MNDKVEEIKLRELFNAIRNEEIKNVKTQKYDDKQMAARITKYLLLQVGGKEDVPDEV